MVKKRNEIDLKDQWNVQDLFASFQDWEKKYSSIKQNESPPFWSTLAEKQGTLGNGPEAVKETLDELFSLQRSLELLYTYAHLRHDEDINEETAKIAYQKALSLYYQFGQETSWIQPEFLSLSEEKLEEYVKSPLLQEYQIFLKKILRLKPHTLSLDNEKLLALSSQALATASNAFRAMTDGDFRFGKAKDSKGEEKEITHGTYSLYLQEKDRVLRENVFKTYHQKYAEFKNTLAELLQGQVQHHLFDARARNYKSCLEASLYPHQIDVSVYQSLIETVHKRISSLHRYMDLRKKLLEVDELHLYDLHVPLSKSVDIRMNYTEAEEKIIESVSPLGKDYQDQLKKGLLEGRWVDRYENENKRSGAYSSGCYDSMPYILMNYKEILRDVFTLAHEAGHSMHSFLSHQNQNYQDSHYPIFLAEVASTFNEELLMRNMIEKAKTKEEKVFLINQKLDDIRGTLFRQTMFAEFELKIHEFAEKNIPLTPALLEEEYLKLNQFYFGDSVVIDPEISAEWSRIPHFYYNFYVYQYATGISAALALSKRVLQGGYKERDEYLSLLIGGGSKFPLEMLKMAGVDMKTSLPIESAIDRFDDLLDELEQLTSSSQEKIPRKESTVSS